MSISPITLRLSPEKRLIFEAQASHRGQSLGIYLRELLENQDTSSHITANLESLLSSFLSSFTSLSNPSSTASLIQKGLWVEILLLLRLIAGPEKMLLVQKELQRLKLPLWKGDPMAETASHEPSTHL